MRSPGVVEVNLLNIGLMLASCALAFALPFELFLFAYAVLGPLHYLTEISWLHERGYFAEGGRSGLAFAGVAVGLCAVLFAVQFLLPGQFARYGATIILTAFGLALAIVFLRSTLARIAVAAGIGASGLLLDELAPYQILFAILLPTLIHVFLFTGLFILWGALKGGTRTGLLSLVVFGACALSFFYVRPFGTIPGEGSYVRQAYGIFDQLNVQMLALLYPDQAGGEAAAWRTGGALAVMRFIAFAYTYHYLNWFSKTSIIRWHAVPKARTVGMIALWLASLGLYGYDYEVGMTALYFLSLLHVFLEFPLNHRSFVGVAEELSAPFRSPASSPARVASKAR